MTPLTSLCLFYRKEITLLDLISRGRNLSTEEAGLVTPLLSLLSSLFSRALFTVHDNEFYGEEGKTLAAMMEI